MMLHTLATGGRSMEVQTDWKTLESPDTSWLHNSYSSILVDRSTHGYSGYKHSLNQVL